MSEDKALEDMELRVGDDIKITLPENPQPASPPPQQQQQEQPAPMPQVPSTEPQSKGNISKAALVGSMLAAGALGGAVPVAMTALLNREPTAVVREEPVPVYIQDVSPHVRDTNTQYELRIGSGDVKPTK